MERKEELVLGSSHDAAAIAIDQVLEMTLNLKIALVVTEGVESYQRIFALKWIFPDLFVEVTTSPENFLKMAIRRGTDVADVAVPTMRVTFLADLGAFCHPHLLLNN